ncbi:ferritin-like domain-containing protein [Flavobacterium sp. MAH-1]|uniref:Ferritin-like domain-containing protein n=1 Tax=Flavobacterium agri TaxID=2743471 RepID=A0A7Y9C4Q7_9FLAO|nr:ferritin-like domain-containing protein [Flavobacterium agri]NUY79564.1 ferritin-like domain-containing protein [Flavobacterium agri]NYA69589.1 ferritin-like domain-containing protein [Flavobacterium agri]
MYTNSSQYWTNHFTHNATFERVDWDLEPKLLDGQKKRILKSLQAWQLGETSEGAHLLAAARKYAKTTNDFIFPIAVELFIKEEQKHGNNLGRYLDLIGEKRVSKDWGDSLFRKIRYFNTSMELWTLAVITVESAAQLFYQSLKDATGCPLLKQICDDILIDEAHHIDFQAERMLAIYRSHHWSIQPIAFAVYRTFFFCTAAVVWFGHSKVLSVGSPTFGRYMKDMAQKFQNTFGRIKKEVESPTSLVPMR